MAIQESRPGKGQLETQFGNERPQNAFLIFLEQNQALIGSFRDAEEAFIEEREGWRRSTAFDLLCNEGSDILVEFFTSRGIRFDEDRVRKSYKDWTTAGTFYSDAKTQEEVVGKVFSGIPEAGKKAAANMIEPVVERWKAFIDDYEAAIKPLEVDRSEKKDELLSAVGGFFYKNIGNIMDFERFLSDPIFNEEKEKNKRLLAAVAEAEQTPDGSLIEKGASDAIVYEGETPLPEYLLGFIKARPRAGSDMWTLLDFGFRLAKLPLTEENSMAAARLISESLPLPPIFVTEYKKYLSQIVNPAVLSIKKNLFPYAPRYRTIHIYQPSFNRQQSRNATRGFSNIPTVRIRDDSLEEHNEEAKEEKVPYEVGLISQAVSAYNFEGMTEEEIDTYIQRTANKIAKGDVRMRHDIRTLISDLSLNPYGKGTEILTNQTIGIGAKVFSLRSLIPDKRPTVSIEHESTRDLRLVYIVDSKKRTVAIKGIYPHSEFDKEFA